MSDTARQIEKALDVLRQVEKAMTAEAEMNAAKHMAAVVRPVPLAAAVSSLIVDYEAWLYGLERRPVMRRAIVVALDSACDLTHTLRVDWFGCRLATLSDNLDQRWGTGVWKEAP